MLKLLTGIFIRDRDNVTDPKVRQAYGSLCGFYGIFLNIVLFAGKYFAGVISGSVAITADAFNNLSDAGSSVISLLGFAIAGKKPDPDHPYGHGRVEYLSGLLLSALIIIMGVELAKTSFDKILRPEAVQAGILPAVILLVSIAVKFYMSMYNRAVGRKINSASMLATAADSLSDSVATAVVLLSMGIAWLFKVNIDGYAGLLVALFIVYAGINACRETISPLLGQSPDPELVRQIEDIAMSFDEIVGIHDLIVHDYGPGRVFASLHAEVDGFDDVFKLHDAIDVAEKTIHDKLGVLVSIHMDPIDSRNEKLAEMRSAVSEAVKEIDERITIHDFRMVPGPTHTNLIFDAVLTQDAKLTDSEAAEKIKELVSSRWPGYFAVVDIDRSFV